MARKSIATLKAERAALETQIADRRSQKLRIGPQ